MLGIFSIPLYQHPLVKTSENIWTITYADYTILKLWLSLYGYYVNNGKLKLEPKTAYSLK